MKKYRIPLVLVLILALAAAFLVVNNRRGTLYSKDNQFAVSDTSNVTKLFFADKKNNTVTLERQADGRWLLNQKFPANSESMRTMMKTLISIDVKTPVAKAARNNIIRLLAAKSVKVEVYQRVFRVNLFDKIRLFPHEKLTRTYYVGDATMDNRGTFMLMEGSEEPYIVYIPGFRGFVATRYSALEGDWRDHTIFSYKLPDIARVTASYSEKPEYSFSIENNNNSDFVLTGIDKQTPLAVFDTLKVIEYLGSFRRISYEALVNDMSKAAIDSITASTPFVTLTVTDRLGKTHSIQAWKRKATEGQIDMDGNPMEWDMDRMYAQVGDTGDFVLIQFFVFDKVLRPLPWFTSPRESEEIYQ